MTAATRAGLCLVIGTLSLIADVVNFIGNLIERLIEFLEEAEP